MVIPKLLAPALKITCASRKSLGASFLEKATSSHRNFCLGVGGGGQERVPKGQFWAAKSSVRALFRWIQLAGSFGTKFSACPQISHPNTNGGRRINFLWLEIQNYIAEADASFSARTSMTRRVLERSSSCNGGMGGALGQTHIWGRSKKVALYRHFLQDPDCSESSPALYDGRS